MKRNIIILVITVIMLSMIGCVTPLNERIFVKNYEHRIVRVVPVTYHKVVNVKVYHAGPLTKAERNDLKRWYKHKHRRPHHNVKVVFIRN
jgi:ABC-type molybdate transport system substrate-binding protein